MSNSLTIGSIVICTLILLWSREMYLWGQIDTADEKIHGLDAKVLYEEDNYDTTQVRGNRVFKINEISGY